MMMTIITFKDMPAMLDSLAAPETDCQLEAVIGTTSPCSSSSSCSYCCLGHCSKHHHDDHHRQSGSNGLLL